MTADQANTDARRRLNALVAILCPAGSRDLRKVRAGAVDLIAFIDTVLPDIEKTALREERLARIAHQRVFSRR